MTLGAIDSNIAGTNSLALLAGAGAINLNGIIGGTIPLADLTVTGNAIDINTNSITTSGSQAYNGPVIFGLDATLTGMNIAFNNGISGGHNLTLIGQPGNNLFALTGPLALNNVNVIGSAIGSNALIVTNINSLSYIITGNDQGNITASGVTGLFNFGQIHSLNGSIVDYVNNPTTPQPVPTIANRPDAGVARILSPYYSANVTADNAVLATVFIINDTKTTAIVSNNVITADTVLSSLTGNQHRYLNTLAKAVTGTSSQDIRSLSSRDDAQSNVDMASIIAIIALLLAVIMRFDLMGIRMLLHFINTIPAANLRLLARALTAANAENIKLEKAQPAGGRPINNAIDIAKLLEGGLLPEGFAISSFFIIPGATVSCIVTDPSRRIAIFKATGVKRKSTVNY